jgi:hypothetical protein
MMNIRYHRLAIGSHKQQTSQRLARRLMKLSATKLTKEMKTV